MGIFKYLVLLLAMALIIFAILIGNKYISNTIENKTITGSKVLTFGDGTMTVICKKTGKIVNLKVSVFIPVNNQGALSGFVSPIPEDFRPSENTAESSHYRNNNMYSLLSVQANGNIVGSFNNNSGTDYTFTHSITYIQD